MKIKIVSIIFGLVVLFFTVASAAASQSVVIKFEGRTLELKQAPYIDNGSVMVPLRGVFEQVGIKVHWGGKDRKVTATSNNQEIVLKIGSKTGYVNGKEFSLNSPPIIKNNTTYVPLRFLITHSGFLVNWDQKSKTVSISTLKPSNRTINESDQSTQADTKNQPLVKGKVLDSTGKPVSGVTVRFLYLNSVAKDYTSTTLQDGTFSNSELHPGTEYIVRAAPPKGHPDNESEDYRFRYEGKELQLPPMSFIKTQITGKVILNQNEAIDSIVDIVLEEIQPDGSHLKISSGFVDEEDKFKLSGLTVGKEYIIYAQLYNKSTHKYTTLDVISSNNRFVYQAVFSNLELKLSKPAENPYIQLLTPEGTGVNDNNIGINAVDSSGKFYSTQSAEDGKYRIFDLKPGTSVTISVQINGGNKYKAPASITFTYQTGKLNLGEIRLLVQSLPQITGMVLDEQGKAINRFVTDIYDLNTNEVFTWSWSDSNGKFTLNNLQTGHRYQIVIINNMSNNVTTTTLNDYVRPPKYEFVYDPTMTTIPTFITPKVQMIGRVIEPNGTQLNAYSRLYDVNGTLISEFATKLDHQFAVGGMIAGQSYRLELVISRIINSKINLDNPPKLPKLYSHTFVYQPSMTRFDDIVFDIDATSPGMLMAVRGKVVDKNGNPVAGVWVQTEQMVNGQMGSVMVKTNSSGDYVFYFGQPTQGEIYVDDKDGISSKVSFSVVDRDISVPKLIYSKYGE